MGFGKIKKEVEASGLDPQVAHVDLTVDGHLVSPPAHTTVSAYYEPEKLKEILATYPQDESGVPEIVYEQFVEADSVEEFTTKVTEAATSGIQKAVQDIRNKGIPAKDISFVVDVVTEDSVAETKENEEDIAYVQKLLFDNLKQVEETEEVQESPKTDSKVKEKKAPTKKKPTKK